MKISISLFLFISFGALSFAGTKEDIEQVQRNVLELQQQFWNLDSTLKANNTALQSTAKKLEESSEQLRDNQAALNAKLESILNQIQALGEKLEETNRRIKELGSGGYQQPAATPANPNLDDSDFQMLNPSPSNPQTGVVPGQGTVSEQQLFQAARAQYSQGKFEQALRGFQDLLDQYPGSSLADDAQFMIGEAYYNMKEYVDAVAEYDKVIKRYPDSDNVPGARLKKAFALFSLGKKGQAVVELQQIVARYPSSKEAQIAGQRLAELVLD
jgi:tol-pal system protein YbgF